MQSDLERIIDDNHMNAYMGGIKAKKLILLQGKLDRYRFTSLNELM